MIIIEQRASVFPDIAHPDILIIEFSSDRSTIKTLFHFIVKMGANSFQNVLFFFFPPEIEIDMSVNPPLNQAALHWKSFFI